MNLPNSLSFTHGTQPVGVQETPLTLGEFLRHQREQKGITIEQVASASKVGVRLLHALEADQYMDLPAKPFIRGFVISYCRFIRLDSKEVLSRFEDFLTLKSCDRIQRSPGYGGYAFEKKDGDQQSRTFLIVTIFFFIFMGGVATLLLKPSLGRHRNTQIEKLKAVREIKKLVDVSQLSLETVADGENTKTLGIHPEIVRDQTPSPPTQVKKDSPLSLETSHPTNSHALVPINASQTTRPSTLTGISSPLKEQIPSRAPSSMEKPQVLSDESFEEGAVKTSHGFPFLPPAVEPLPSQALLPVSDPIHLKDEPSQVPEEENVYALGKNPQDPLDSGAALKRNDIQHKVIFKISSDVWVRYQVDQRPIRKFIIRKGNLLILRAKKKIYFQTSHPKSVSFDYNHKGFQLMTENDEMQNLSGNPTLLFPETLYNSIKEPFPKPQALPAYIPLKIMQPSVEPSTELHQDTENSIINETDLDSPVS